MSELLILETEHTTAVQASGYRVPGYVIVQPKAECTSLAGMSPDAATDLFECLIVVEDIVQRLVEPGRIYIAKFAEMNPQVHFHVIPRTERIARAYLEDVSDAEPYVGARVVDWLWEHHALLGYSDDDITAFVRQARRMPRRG